MKELETNYSHQGCLPSLLGRAYTVKATKDTSTNVLDQVARTKPVRDGGTGSNVEKVIQKSRKERGGINESYNCLRGDLHDGQVGLRCNHILRHFSW